MKLITISIISVFIAMKSHASSPEIVKIAKPDKGNFSRTAHSEEVLVLALQKTAQKYGDFKIVKTIQMSRNRALKELKTNTIDVHIVPTRSEWEENSIPIYIPVSKGILGYRVMMIRKEDQSIYSKSMDLNKLKILRAGLGSQWSTTKVLNKLNYNVVTGNNYRGLFGMLNEGRFDYFLRGINEVYGEYSEFKEIHKSIKIEDTLVVYIPLPIYIFVSQKNPKLAIRIEEGLELAIADGSFDKLFYKAHKINLDKATLNSRKLLNIGNPLLKENKNTNNPRYWYKP